MKKLAFVFMLLLLSSCAIRESPCVQEKLRDAQLRSIVENNGYGKGTILITLEDNVPKENVTALLSSHNLTIRYDYESLKMMAVNVPKGEELEWICTLESSELVKNGELDILLKTQY